MPSERTITVPNIGDFKDVEVIEIGVQPGDTVQPEQALISLESDKATMEIPAPAAGVVRKLLVKIGDRVSEGTPIIVLEESAADNGAAGEAAAPAPAGSDRTASAGKDKETAAAAPIPARTQTDRATGAEGGPRPVPSAPIGAATVSGNLSAKAYASPAVRRFARELGVDLGLVRGSGRRGRIVTEDVKAFTKAVLSGNRVFEQGGGFSLPQIPAIDFSKFGPVETQPLPRIKRLGGQNLHRSWINVPHVTQFDEADITELEEFRKSKLDEAKRKGLRLTLLTFLVKASVVALKKYPAFNASLTPDGESLVLKHYYHIGIAVDTEQGLMVPVVHDADQKGLFDIAAEVAQLAEKARTKKLGPDSMQGGCFTISSLGHIGGTGFTPIINTPELAILGVSRAEIKPVYLDGKFEPRLILPYSLSYDHRAIDGVAAAEFTRYLGTVLADIRDILL
jgi:pyruvate dehydrogenase E2 component (dihydrolipoamide acetyltransferase)